MEQKKTLWIVAASGVFLLVVLGAALLLNAPSSSAPATASITTIEKPSVAAKLEEPAISPIETPSVQAGALDSNTLAFQNIESAEPLPAPSESAQNTVPENSSQGAQVAAAPSTTTIELNAAPSSAVTATSRAGQEALSNAGAKAAASSSTIYTAAPGTSAASKTAASSNVAKAPASNSGASAAKAAPKAQAAAPAKKAPALSSKYWVQAASFTNKKSADNARAALDDNKIPAEVFTYKDNKDNLFYRVRVGPYTTKSEAEYWKTRVCKIDLFKDTQSYVTEIKM